MLDKELKLCYDIIMIRLSTQKEVAKHLKISPASFNQMLKNNPRMPKIKVGRNYRFNVESIDKWIEKKLFKELKQKLDKER